MTAAERELLNALADILVRNGLDAVATDSTVDLFPPGTPVGATARLAGDAALSYARRQELSIALGLSELNAAVLALGLEVRSLRPRRPRR